MRYQIAARLEANSNSVNLCDFTMQYRSYLGRTVKSSRFSRDFRWGFMRFKLNAYSKRGTSKT